MPFNALIVGDSDIVRTIIPKTLGLAKVPLHEVHEASKRLCSI